MITKTLKEDFENVIKGVADLKEFKGKSVLITGATGLIGSLTVKFFAYLNKNYAYGVKVYSVVRNVQKANAVISCALKDESVQLICCDLETQPLSGDGQIDYIVHTASITASKEMVQNPERVLSVALVGTQKALDLAREKGAKLIYLSSMEAYGTMPTDEKATEDMLGIINLDNPRSAYPLSKRKCEELCKRYYDEFGVQTTCARLAQTFGAGVDITDNRVFNQFAKSVMYNQDVILHTDGSSHGNYVYTADCLKALLILMLKGEGGQVYNVANEDCHTTIFEMAKLVCEKVANGKIALKIELGDLSKLGYAPKTVLNLSSKKLSSLGWSASVSLENCYKRLIAHYEETNAFEG
jgi:nucleoside-diphosphate-sugar epimerase